MEQTTCCIDDCDGEVFARTACYFHYGRAYRAGLVDMLPKKPRKHQLSNINIEALTCDCSKCGEGVPLRIRRRYKNPEYACQNGDRGRRSRRRRGSGATVGSRRWVLYGISDEEYEIRLAAQGGRCLICQEKMLRPVIDHDHASGQVRGLLCISCNAGLGFFRDNVQALARAAKYVRQYAS